MRRTIVKHKDLLSAIAEQYKHILRENLVGIYVHGSIGFGCFHWDRSDIDFIAVVKKPLSQAEKAQLLDVLTACSSQAPPKGLEMSIVLAEHCNTFLYPTPYELHFSKDCWAAYLDNPLSLCHDETKTDADLAAHFTVIKAVGIRLCGEPIAEVFGNIPKEDYLDSICKDIEQAKECVIDNPVSVILNLCRVYAYRQDGAVLSKETGGQWSFTHLPEKYHSLIQAALDYYVKGTAFCIDEQLTNDFCDDMLHLIFHALDIHSKEIS